MRFEESRFKRVARTRESGATASEYALLISGIALVLLVVITLFGESLANHFVFLQNTLFP